ncbi:unnamed protein product [Alopecurus aequalis]
MTRRRPGRRAARREGTAHREERAAAPPHYGDVERRLAEEVLYLHSLWRAGPPAPAPAPHPGGGSLATHIRADRRKRRRLERVAEPEDPGYEWPLAPSPPASPSPASWPDASSSSPTQQPPPPQPSPGWLAQRTALRAAEEFFSGHTSDEDEKEGSESEDAGEAAAGFFLRLFEQDAELRGYYERSYEQGEFMCMRCAGRKLRKGRARRFRDCVSLVRHAHAATHRGRRRAHRAFAATVCRVLGWDIERLPSIVIDPRGTLGQSLAKEEATATSHEAKENVEASLTTENDNENAAKEDASLEKNSSSSDKDVDTGMNDDLLNDGVAEKEDVDTMKSGPSSNVNDGEVHEQENVIESAAKEITNDTDPLSSKDTAMELSKSVQEEEGAIDNKQEHAKSAEDMGGTCNVSLENNSPKEEAARENKERTNNVVGTGDNDIGNLGTNLMDSSKVVYSGTHDI